MSASGAGQSRQAGCRPNYESRQYSARDLIRRVPIRPAGPTESRSANRRAPSCAPSSWTSNAKNYSWFHRAAISSARNPTNEGRLVNRASGEIRAGRRANSLQGGPNRDGWGSPIAALAKRANGLKVPTHSDNRRFCDQRPAPTWRISPVPTSRIMSTSSCGTGIGVHALSPSRKNTKAPSLSAI
jgi:hypothetical protein